MIMIAIKLESADKVYFDIGESIGRMSILLTDKMSKYQADATPMLAVDVRSDILRLVIQWAEFHENDAQRVDCDSDKSAYIPEWDREFLSSMQNSVLHQLLLAAEYLGFIALTDTISNFKPSLCHDRQSKVSGKLVTNVVIFAV